MNDLFAEFAASSQADWERAMSKALKARPLESLDWQAGKNLILKPLYRQPNGSDQPIAWAQKAGWLIAERFFFYGEEPSQERQILLDALNGGVQLLDIVLTAAAVERLPEYLEGVWLDMIQIRWQPDNLQTAALLAQKLQSLGQQLQGQICLPSAEPQMQVDFLQKWQPSFPNMRFLSVHCPEGELVDSLAEVMGQIYALYELLGDWGLLANQLELSFSVDKRFWLQIAKLRAIKKLWFALGQSLDQTSEQLPTIYAETLSDWAENPNYNLIVAATQALSAVAAGVDALLVRPAAGWAKADANNRRLARNVQHLLIEESHLDAVADPAAGAYYIENATQQLIEGAWELFQRRHH